jgi:hypothetical protein
MLTGEDHPFGPITTGTYFPWRAPPQTQADAAVVIPTVGRTQLDAAIGGIFEQDLPGLVQILVGVDSGGQVPATVQNLVRRKPDRMSLHVLHLPFSTSERHGGVHPPRDGGGLRAILSYMANSRLVAYLDDDNRWTRSHLSALRAAIENKAYAFSHRALVDEVSRAHIAVDIWDSVGPGAGRFSKVGGFVDPSCLMVDKLAIGAALGRWAQTASGAVEPGADLWFYRGINGLPHGDSKQVTVEYAVREDNPLREFARLNLSPEQAIERRPALGLKPIRSSFR